MALTAGSLLFSSKAATYYENIPFRIKMVCLAFAAVNMLVFHFDHRARCERLGQRQTAPESQVAGAISLALWVVIVATGRWIGFTT